MNTAAKEFIPKARTEPNIVQQIPPVVVFVPPPYYDSSAMYPEPNYPIDQYPPATSTVAKIEPQPQKPVIPKEDKKESHAPYKGNKYNKEDGKKYVYVQKKKDVKKQEEVKEATEKVKKEENPEVIAKPETEKPAENIQEKKAEKIEEEKEPEETKIKKDKPKGSMK